MDYTEQMINEASAMFAKTALLGNVKEAEADRILLDNILGIGGSFYTKIIDAMWSAHPLYKQKLVDAFPELISIYRYITEPGYWEEFKKKYRINIL